MGNITKSVSCAKEEVVMKRDPISTRRIAFVLLSIVLPLTAFACNASPEITQGDATATATATTSPALPMATGGNYILEISWEGSYTLPNGYVTATYGPNTAQVYLVPSGDTYIGSYEGIFDAAVTGTCTATGAIPVTFDVTAQEGEFQDLDFSVIRSYVWSWATICPGLSGGSTSPTLTYTYIFTLPAEDGASETFSQAGPTWIFTLKVP
jgi:hypothetical protein